MENLVVISNLSVFYVISKASQYCSIGFVNIDLGWVQLIGIYF